MLFERAKALKLHQEVYVVSWQSGTGLYPYAYPIMQHGRVVALGFDREPEGLWSYRDPPRGERLLVGVEIVSRPDLLLHAIDSSLGVSVALRLRGLASMALAVAMSVCGVAIRSLELYKRTRGQTGDLIYACFAHASHSVGVATHLAAM